MANTILGNVIEFFEKIGIYDVVLPFLLVFTLVFAILDRTKILGVEEIKGEKYSKKNLNALLAFTIAFLVVASSKLVETIVKVSSQVVVLIMLVVFFLILVGTFYKEGELAEEGFKEKGRGVIFLTLGIALVFIFLNAIVARDGRTWLQVLIDYVNRFWTSTAVASVILIIVLIAFVYFLTYEKTEEKKSGS